MTTKTEMWNERFSSIVKDTEDKLSRVRNDFDGNRSMSPVTLNGSLRSSIAHHQGPKKTVRFQDELVRSGSEPSLSMSSSSALYKHSNNYSENGFHKRNVSSELDYPPRNHFRSKLEEDVDEPGRGYSMYAGELGDFPGYKIPIERNSDWRNSELDRYTDGGRFDSLSKLRSQSPQIRSYQNDLSVRVAPSSAAGGSHLYSDERQLPRSRVELREDLSSPIIGSKAVNAIHSNDLLQSRMELQNQELEKMKATVCRLEAEREVRSAKVGELQSSVNKILHDLNGGGSTPVSLELRELKDEVKSLRAQLAASSKEKDVAHEVHQLRQYVRELCGKLSSELDILRSRVDFLERDSRRASISSEASYSRAQPSYSRLNSSFSGEMSESPRASTVSASTSRLSVAASQMPSTSRQSMLTPALSPITSTTSVVTSRPPIMSSTSSRQSLATHGTTTSSSPLAKVGVFTPGRPLSTSSSYDRHSPVPTLPEPPSKRRQPSDSSTSSAPVSTMSRVDQSSSRIGTLRDSFYDMNSISALQSKISTLEESIEKQQIPLSRTGSTRELGRFRTSSLNSSLDGSTSATSLHRAGSVKLSKRYQADYDPDETPDSDDAYQV